VLDVAQLSTNRLNQSIACGQIREALLHADIRDIAAPDLVDAFDLYPAKQLGIDVVAWSRLAQLRLWIDRRRLDLSTNGLSQFAGRVSRPPSK
jgi:hypothetical protein